MRRKFNTEAQCNPKKHYMVKLDERMRLIREDYIDKGSYFVISRGRQYGKTTTLFALEEYLKPDYLVVLLDFQELGSAEFKDEFIFSKTFAEVFLDAFEDIGVENAEEITAPLALLLKETNAFTLRELFARLSKICKNAQKPIVLIIDEIDGAGNNQVFIDFLALLRRYYINRERKAIFQSVVLAGVYDIKNLKLKLRPDAERQYNSPWNIAADFTVNMDFSPDDIASMLQEYEEDNHTGMDIPQISRLIYEYTSGYPYLVSRICQLADERLAGTADFPDRQDVWTKEGITAAELMLRKQPNMLFDDMVKKLVDYPGLKKMIQDILFCGSAYPFERENYLINLGVTFGFIKDNDGTVAVRNRIFETKLYDLFLSEMIIDDTLGQPVSVERSQYIVDGTLQMRLVMEKFYQHFTEIYGDSNDKFIEKHGRKVFLLYLKPIINGSGNYYIEAQTRDAKRTDIIVDYRGRQYIIELKIWHGNEYNQRGEKQLFEYLDYYKSDTGYMLSFNFNKNKITGIHEIVRDGKRIFEVTV